ncbi:xanthine phosphoribosyltransferase [Anaerosolibacter carboniphilus]|uniref:Xanthine phosphoribosyltransferase n=1 Tax=Anaerosolibacter carboniphilus TaxID=1417629 RepID=A0A841KUZ9_9FIRM|nr:xanthine phosphoribosyltransferase [Anaerosolibacter carboniphilus]MBB6217203.1 xanthine phosphoribosyltransferase [Anaerosolibacter carboniphilus]
MEALREKIRQEGEVVSSSILKVDSFLNHQIDAGFMMEIGREFAHRFQDEKITKVVTIEASGIAPALTAAAVLGVPVVFAKKTKATTMDTEVYVEQVESFTRGTTYDIKVSKKFLHKEDRVLIIDDFLAYGHAALGLAKIVKKSGAQLVGVGAVIEKGFQSGGELLRGQGIRVESLAIVERMEEKEIIFK